MIATSSGIIRSLAAGVAGAGGLAVQASARSIEIYTQTEASIGSSTVTASGEVLVNAADTAPATVPDYMQTMDVLPPS